MRLARDGRRLHLGYTTNVHRGGNLAALEAELKAELPELRRALGYAGPLALDLHLPLAAARALLAPRAWTRWRRLLDELRVYVCGLNGFPLGDFQAPVVKDRVYRPHWGEVERLEATLLLGECLARLLPPGATGSVSTLAGAYRRHAPDTPALRRRMAAQLVRAAAGFAELSAKCGRQLRLALEPEPDTTLEGTEDTLRFYEEELLPEADRQGVGGELLRRHLALVLDACHLSVLFEDPAGALTRWRTAGLRVAKVHISAAPAVPHPAENAAGLAFLLGLAEPRFLHQTAGRDEGGRVRLRVADLEDLSTADLKGIAEVRSHFHLPLTWPGGEGAATTRPETEALLAAAEECREIEAYVLETYTWPILQGTRLRELKEPLGANLGRELAWVRALLRRRGWREVEA